MAARGNDGVVEKVLADLAAEGGFERREKRQWRVEPVGGVRDIVGRLHEAKEEGTGAADGLTASLYPCSEIQAAWLQELELELELSIEVGGGREHVPRPAD